MIRIITDSTSDLTASWREEQGILMLPLTIHFGSESYRDSIDLDSRRFYAMLREAKTLPTTSQVPPGEFEEAFRPLVSQGDEIIVITISSHLSATHASALSAAEEVAADQIHVVDSLSGSFGTALLIRQAVRLRDEGRLSAREIAQRLRALAPRVRISAAVDSLKYLKMGGRLSGSQAFIGTLLGIKPLIEVSEGRVSAIGRIRGEKNVIKSLIERFTSARPDLRYGVAFGNSDAPELMEATIQGFLPHLAGADIHTSDLGAVIGTHTGPGVVGVAYVLQEE